MVPPTKKAASSSSGKPSTTSTSQSSSSNQPTGANSPSANPASDGDPSTTPAVGTTEVKTVEVEAKVTTDAEAPKKPKNHTEDREFVIPQTTDPRRNIPGTSQYLDEVERRNAELIRAKAEDRKPDLKNPPAFQGTPLYTEAQAKQQGLDVSGKAVQHVKLPVVVADHEEADAAFQNYDAANGAGASVLVNSGEPRG